MTPGAAGAEALAGVRGRSVAGGRQAPAIAALEHAHRLIGVPAVRPSHRFPLAALALVFLVPCVTPRDASAQAAAAKEGATRPPLRHGLWVAFGMGGGQVERWSDQEPGATTTTITMSVRGGLTVVPALRLGLEINGWGIETSDVSDPSKGVTVNETMVIAQVYPWPAKGVYLKGGIGWGEFNTGHAGDIDSHAFGATILGAGYDIRVARNVFITLVADWALGPLGDAHPLVVTSTGRQFRAFALNAGIQYH